ncbi:MAG TPA: hypothetical protein PKC30_12745 [Saprospiraceae bacterium]|nr:hypothetical protein [Saprospiraceae bacterium]
MKVVIKNYVALFILAGWVFHLNSCVKAPDFPLEPEIDFVGFSKSTMNQGGLNNDSTFMTISFQDGDGDIGHPANSTMRSLFIIDKRTGNIYNQFKVPEIPEQGVGNGVRGEITVLMYTTCCIFPDLIPPCSAPSQFPTNDLSFEVYLVDRAGNESNRINTGIINLLCN